MSSIRIAFLLTSSFAAVACGDDPISHSSPVGINLKAKSADTTGGVVTDEKGINTESGNPYGAFVNDATDHLGHDPSAIDIASIEIFLGANSTGVVTLGEIFEGTVEVLFEMNDTDNSYPVASTSMTAATGSGPITIESDFHSADIAEADFEKLLSGSFKVIARGPAAPEFETKGADADLQITFVFAAYE